MTRGRSGGVLLVALTAVTVAALLAVGASLALRASLARISGAAELAGSSRAALAGIERFAVEILSCDSNDFDAATEIWRLPFPAKDDPEAGLFAIVPEFPGGDAVPCIDEESRIPLNTCPEEPLAAIIASLSGKSLQAAKAMAADIVAARPLHRREFLRAIPSIDGDTFLAILPHVTAAPVDKININTASRQVLEALFAAAARYGASSSAKSLAAKILDFRAKGGVFESLDPAAMDAALGGLNQTEALSLAAVKDFMTVKSRYFSGAAVSGGARVVFTFDKEEGALPRIAIGRAPGIF